MPTVVRTMKLSQSSSIAGSRNSTTATEHSAPRAIRLHIEEMISTLEYRPTPNVEAKKLTPLTRMDCADAATASPTATFFSLPAILPCLYRVVIRMA